MLSLSTLHTILRWNLNSLQNITRFNLNNHYKQRCTHVHIKLLFHNQKVTKPRLIERANINLISYYKSLGTRSKDISTKRVIQPKVIALYVYQLIEIIFNRRFGA